MEQYIVDISHVEPCRVCNSLEGSLNILTDQLEDEDVPLHEALEFVTCLKVDTDDGMSLSLCLSCAARLLDAFRFKNQALDSCKHFSDLHTNIVSVKDVEIEGSEIVLHLEETPEQVTDIIAEEDTTGDEPPPEEDKPEVDMSTDAVAFLIEQYVLKNNKKPQPAPAPEPIDNDWVSESIRQNPKPKHGKYECQICNKKLPKKSNLVDHLRLHANVKKFVCSYCGKSFVQIANYQMHVRIHTKERPFQCALCGKSYNQSSTLKVHIRSHTQERNYVCPVCDKTFTNASDLSKHKKTHYPSQQHKCEYCGKCFAQKVNMKTHQRKYHSEVS